MRFRPERQQLRSQCRALRRLGQVTRRFNARLSELHDGAALGARLASDIAKKVGVFLDLRLDEGDDALCVNSAASCFGP